MIRTDAIFLHNDVREIFQNKVVVVLGDSIQRSVYKDLVCLWSDPQSRYVEDYELRRKGEISFRQDKLLLGGELAEKTNGTDYKEEREFRAGGTVFRYYFITRCWNDYVESILQNHLRDAKPHVIIVNSCYWDIHRYGIEGKKLYEYNMNKLFTAVSRLPSQPLLVWNSALPLADICKGGFFRKGFNTISRCEIEMANAIAFALTKTFRYIYVDLFESISRHHMFTQAEDGIHWGNKAHRNISNSILSAISDCWGYNVAMPFPPMRQSQIFMTPQPAPLIHRYHPYFPPQMSGLRYHPAFTMDVMRRHRRSQTDPFPLGQQLSRQQYNYRSRFKTVNKKTMPTTPLASKYNAANTSSTLQDCNTSAKLSVNSTPLTSKQESSVTFSSVTDKKESECSASQNAVDVCPGNGPSPEASTGCSHTSSMLRPLKFNVGSNSTAQSEEEQQVSANLKSVLNSTDTQEVKASNSLCNADKEIISHSGKKSDEVGVVSLANQESAVSATDKSKTGEVDNDSNTNIDINNNENNANVVNERKRKRETERNEEDEEQAKKIAKCFTRYSDVYI